MERRHLLACGLAWVLMIAAATLGAERATTTWQRWAGHARKPNRLPSRASKRCCGSRENFWGWDAAVFGALQARQCEVSYVNAGSESWI